MRKRTTIHTMRHARTRYNAERRYAGTIDIDLSEEGRTDARQAAARLVEVELDVVVTSTLKRSLETARLLVGKNVPIVQSALCRERNFGIMEGLTWDEIQVLQPPIMLVRVGNDLHTVNPKGGEPFEAVWERARKFRQYLFRHYGGKSVLVISHGVFLQMFHGVLSGSNCIESLARFPANLELASFQFEGERLAREKRVELGGQEALRW